MSQPKVSVIIPVHNAGKYFEECLISVVNQTLTDIEIILVLDCPTDGSDEIAERFASQDRRIKLLYNKENLHTGFSRNRGVEAAKGKYIGFLDHDDYCDLSMYDFLYNKAEQEQLEVVRCNFSCVYKNNSRDREEPYNYPEAVNDISYKRKIYEYVCGDKVSCVIWNHLYRADFLEENGLTFLDSRNICSEDSIFFLEVYNKVNRFGIIPDYLYYHVFHTTNTGKIYNYRSIRNRICFFEGLYSFLKKNDISEEESLYYLSENTVRSLYTGSRQALIKLSLNIAFSEIKQIRKNALMMKIIKNLDSSISHKLKPTIRVFLLMLK